MLRLKELDDKNDFQLVTQWYKLSNATYLMNKTRINQKIIAQALLTEIVSDQVLHQKLTITAMKELCKFYILELQLFGSKEALGDAIELVNQLYDTAQNQLSFSHHQTAQGEKSHCHRLRKYCSCYLVGSRSETIVQCAWNRDLQYRFFRRYAPPAFTCRFFYVFNAWSDMNSTFMLGSQVGARQTAKAWQTGKR